MYLCTAIKNVNVWTLENGNTSMMMLCGLSVSVCMLAGGGGILGEMARIIDTPLKDKVGTLKFNDFSQILSCENVIINTKAIKRNVIYM